MPRRTTFLLWTQTIRIEGPSSMTDEEMEWASIVLESLEDQLAAIARAFVHDRKELRRFHLKVEVR